MFRMFKKESKAPRTFEKLFNFTYSHEDAFEGMNP